MLLKGYKINFFTGNKIGGGSHYVGNVSINYEQGFNNIFKEIHSALPKKTIEDKLGVEISIDKKDYTFSTKDSIRLGKSITLNQLEILLCHVSQLMDIEPTYSILPLRLIDKRDELTQLLNKELARSFTRLLNDDEQSNEITILSAEKIYDRHIFKYGAGIDCNVEYNDSSEVLDLFKTYLDTDLENEDMLDAIENTKLVGEYEGAEEDSKSLFEYIDAKILLDERNYWLTDGKWYLLENVYIDRLNELFRKNILGEYEKGFTLNGINPWGDGSEGEYNFSHRENNDTFVLDKIFVDNIEMCDLLIEEDEELYFVHVKSGLNGDVRTLCDQLRHAMETLSAALTYDDSPLKDYYQSIYQKTLNSENNSTMYRSAKIFINKFSDTNSFVNYVKGMKENITFVFAYRPLDSHDFNNPETISSTGAKLSIIDLTSKVSDYGFGFKFLEIKKTIEASEQLKFDEILA